MKLIRKKTKISFDTIAKEYKKLNPDSKIGRERISKIINTQQYWIDYIAWFSSYLDKKRLVAHNNHIE
jgi:hypothetical protein